MHAYGTRDCDRRMHASHGTGNPSVYVMIGQIAATPYDCTAHLAYDPALSPYYEVFLVPYIVCHLAATHISKHVCHNNGWSRPVAEPGLEACDVILTL
jgi:hypothetical protein